MLTTYEIYARKVSEAINGLDRSVIVPPLNFPQNSVVTFDRSTQFKGFFVDFEYMSLNGKLKAITHERCFPINVFNSLKSQLSETDRVKCDKIVLMLGQENSKHVTATKMEKIRHSMTGFSNKRINVRFLILYLFLYLCQKEYDFECNSSVIDMVDDLIIDYVPNIFQADKTDYETFFFITYVFYELHIRPAFSQSEANSRHAEKFLRNLGVWYRSRLWKEFVALTKTIAANPIITLMFTSPKENSHTKAKDSMMYIQNVYEYLIDVGFYLLRLPFVALFDMINSVNDENKDINSNALCEMSKELESHINNSYSTRRVSLKDIQVSIDRDNLVRQVFKQVLSFLNPNTDRLSELFFANKHFYKTFRKSVLKRILQSPVKNKERQIHIWKLIADCDDKFLTIFKRINDSFETGGEFKRDDSCPVAAQIRLDVIRTNFVSTDMRPVLESILINTATEFPILSYYQGMNYIAGFMLNYIQSEETTRKVFNYLICKKMDVYFRNNFAQLKKILFISELLIKRYNPLFDETLSRGQITTDYYLSSFILTLWTNALPQIENYEVIARVFDIMLSVGWLGIFKFVVYLSLRLNEYVIDMRHESLLMFFKKDIYDVIGKFDSDTLVSDVINIPITSAEIVKFGIEYETSRFVVDSYWNNYHEQRKSKILADNKVKLSQLSKN